jgi:hypothetical protein
VGSNLISGSSVQWNGSSLATTFVSSALLTADVPASAVAGPGADAVRRLKKLLVKWRSQATSNWLRIQPINRVLPLTLTFRASLKPLSETSFH